MRAFLQCMEKPSIKKQRDVSLIVKIKPYGHVRNPKDFSAVSSLQGKFPSPPHVSPKTPQSRVRKASYRTDSATHPAGRGTLVRRQVLPLLGTTVVASHSAAVASASCTPRCAFSCRLRCRFAWVVVGSGSQGASPYGVCSDATVLRSTAVFQRSTWLSSEPLKGEKRIRLEKIS